MMLKTKFENGIYTVEINRPEARNALTRELRLLIAEALANPPDDARLVLLRGTPLGFCAGQDLGEFQSGIDVQSVMIEEYQPIITAIDKLDVPIIAAVEGACAGAGVALALACDIVIASQSAFFQVAFGRIGLVPDILTTYYLPRLIGNTRAMGMALTGERMDAPRAKEWGLIWDCYPDEEFETRLDAFTQSMANGPSFALGMTRKLLRVGADHDPETQFALEADCQGKAAASDDFAEGVRAFLEKRAPRFEGR